MSSYWEPVYAPFQDALNALLNWTSIDIEAKKRTVRNLYREHLVSPHFYTYAPLLITVESLGDNIDEEMQWYRDTMKEALNNEKEEFREHVYSQVQMGLYRMQMREQ